MKAKDLVLLPRPRKIELAKASSKIAAITIAIDELFAKLSQHSLISGPLSFSDDFVHISVDPAEIARPQQYRLIIAENIVRILAKDKAGAFYGLQTLKQLARQFADDQMPQLRIEDWPDFPNRGVMWDISRDRVPTMATLYSLVDLLAELKINQFQLYTEHTFAYSKHRKVWEHAAPMTAIEIRELDRYCADRYIELVPNQASFGHFERWLKHDQYKHLAECPDGFTFPWGDKSTTPSVLDPANPGSIALVEELIDELLPNFSSHQLNVGCDETWELGQGKSKDECKSRGKGRVYLDFLLKLSVLTQKHGKTMQFWGDIIMHSPELIPEIPEGVIALEWGYEAKSPFDKHGAKFAESGVPFYVCPGTSSWLSLGGRFFNAKQNLLNAAENGLKHGAVGFLITNWGDGGHFEPPTISYPGLAFGASVCWALDSNRDIDIERALDMHIFRDDAREMASIAIDLANVCSAAGVPSVNGEYYSYILSRPDHEIDDHKLWGARLSAIKNVPDRILEIKKRLSLPKMQRDDAALIIEEYEQTADLMIHGSHLAEVRLKSREKVEKIPVKTKDSLSAELAPLLPRYRRLWLERSREGGLSDSIGRFEKLLGLYGCHL